MDFPTALLKPWVQRGTAFLLGGLGALAFAPIFLFPAILLAFSGIWFFLDRAIEEKSSLWSLFCLGWWFGLGHFAVGLYWIANALTVDLSAFWWVIPFALFGVPAILGVFTGVSFVLTRFWPYRGISRAFAFAAIWVGMEWLRGHIFTGFPWNLVGYSWAFSLEMAQTASLGGVYALTLLTILMAVSLGYLVGRQAFARNVALSIYLIAILFWVWGKNRLNHPDVVAPPSLAIRLVQPNIPQTLKWDLAKREENFQKLLKLTALPSSLPLKAVIWPETAAPFFLEQDNPHRFMAIEKMPKNALLLAGSLRRTWPNETPFQVWNSLLVINGAGNVIAAYDKFHLVPFGEYLPFRNLFDALFGVGTIKKITAGTIDFTAGPGPRTIALPEGFPTFSGLVCYEVIFPSAVISVTEPRPGWMINITNDGWYGRSSGPYQHLEIARFRAIEEGIPLVRAANSGVSAVYDAYGRNQGMLGLEKEGVLDVLLPTPTREIPFYAKWGDWITLSLVFGTLILAWVFSFGVRRYE